MFSLVDVRPYEVRALVLAFLCNFVLMASYYLLRPVRDAMATVFGVDQLQNLFTGTLLLTLVCSPIFAWLTDTFKLSGSCRPCSHSWSSISARSTSGSRPRPTAAGW